MNVVCKNHDQAGLKQCFRTERPHLESIPISSALELSFEQFQEFFVNRNLPVVIRGALTEEWGCMSSWTVDYLRKTVGHVELPLRVNPQTNGTFGSVKQLQDGHLTLYTVEVHPFSSFLDDIEKPNKQFYAARLELVKDMVELVPDIPSFYDFPWRFAFGCPYKQGPIGYFGLGNQTTPLHYDNLENLTFMVKGKKTFKLYPPSESHLLSPCDKNLGTHYSLIENQDSSVLREALHYQVELQEGDLLYLPVCWWHLVHGGEEMNISLNYWMNQHPSKEDFVAYEKYLHESFARTLGQLKTMNLPSSVLEVAEEDSQSIIETKLQNRREHDWNTTTM